MSAEQEVNERKPLLERQGSGSEWSIRDAETLPGGSDSGRSTPTLSPATDGESWRPLIAIFAITAVQPLCFELIFPFINQMIIENGVVNEPEKVGFYTGFIESIFQITGFFSILPCSWISDRYGRKPVVMIGTVGMAISVALFGMSKSYWWMIAMRCVGGTMGGTITAIKVMTVELYQDKRKRARSLSLWQVSYKAGQIVGQPLGGLLSHPARTMPYFDTPFWREYPFALPCFVAAVFALIFTVLAVYTVPETLKRSEPDAACADLVKPKPRSAVWDALNGTAIAILASLFSMAFVSEIIFVTYPLFAFTPIASGGLGLSEPQIGAHMGLRCAFNIVVLLAFTPFASEDSAMLQYKIFMWFWPISITCLPVLNALARTGTEDAGVGTIPFYLFLFFFFTVWSIGNLVWPSSQMVTNKIAPSPEMLASINGIAQMVYSICWAIAPASMTSLFAYSVEHQVLGGNLSYVIMICVCVSAAFQVLVLREKTNTSEVDVAY